MHRTCYSLPRSRMCPFREGIRKKPAPSLSVIVALDRDLMERILCPYGGEEELQDTGRSFACLSNTVETRDALSAEYCSLEIQGSPAVYTRSRIMEDTVGTYSAYLRMDKKAFTDYVKNSYGIAGGSSHALRGSDMTWMEYSSKGIKFTMGDLSTPVDTVSSEYRLIAKSSMNSSWIRA